MLIDLNTLILIFCRIIINLINYGCCKTYEFTEFNHVPNLYLENLGKIRFYHETWKLVNYIDLDELTEQQVQIQNGLAAIIRSCRDCNEKNLLSNLQIHFKMISEDKEKLFSTLGMTKVNRFKRGVFNFIGDISKILFGTMSNSDARYYNNEIDKVYQDNKRITELFKNQTSILRLSLDKTKSLIQDYSYKITQIDDRFKKVEKTMNKVINAEMEREKDNIITRAILELEVAITEYERNIAMILNSIISARHGQINPQLVSPISLMSVLDKIKSVKGSQELPIPVSEDNYFAYLEISDVSIAIIARKLVYEIKLPMLEANEYDAYRIISIPKALSNNAFLYITTPHDYIITNEEKLLFTPSDETYLKTCKAFQNHYICHRMYPKYYIHHDETCLSKIINEPVKLTEGDCTTKMIQIQRTMWIQLKDNVRWMFVNSAPEILRIMCKNSYEDVVIEGTKIIRLEPGCTATTNDVILQAELSYEFKTKHVEPLIRYNFSKEISIGLNVSNNIEYIRLDEIGSPHLEISDLNKLGRSLDGIVRESIEIGNHRRTLTTVETIWFWLEYAGYGILGLVILYVAIKLRFFTCLRTICTAPPCINIFNNCFNTKCRNNVSRNRDKEVHVGSSGRPTEFVEMSINDTHDSSECLGERHKKYNNAPLLHKRKI